MRETRRANVEVSTANSADRSAILVLPSSPDQARALRRYWSTKAISDYLFRSASTDAEIDQKRPVWFVEAMWEVTGILWRSCSSGRSDCGVTTPLANPTLSLRDANETSSPVTTTGRIHSRQLLRRLVRHPRTIMNRPSLGCWHRETTLPSLPEKTELRALP